MTDKIAFKKRHFVSVVYMLINVMGLRLSRVHFVTEG